jgi:hypothetical protein
MADTEEAIRMLEEEEEMITIPLIIPMLVDIHPIRDTRVQAIIKVQEGTVNHPPVQADTPPQVAAMPMKCKITMPSLLPGTKTTCTTISSLRLFHSITDL